MWAHQLSLALVEVWSMGLERRRVHDDKDDN